ncbi:MAG: hypothetical protein JW841_01815 [Deltaproteobacteria bacterium]|nr:hypothetical protein [Deltaproteobacteria bacterium]
MSDQITSIADFLNLPIAWKKQADTPVWSAVVAGESCCLEMNDFPDEPLYTLTWREQSLDIDDKPDIWAIPF